MSDSDDYTGSEGDSEASASKTLNTVKRDERLLTMHNSMREEVILYLCSLWCACCRKRKKKKKTRKMRRRLATPQQPRSQGVTLCWTKQVRTN